MTFDIFTPENVGNPAMQFQGRELVLSSLSLRSKNNMSVSCCCGATTTLASDSDSEPPIEADWRRPFGLRSWTGQSSANESANKIKKRDVRSLRISNTLATIIS